MMKVCIVQSMAGGRICSRESKMLKPINFQFCSNLRNLHTPVAAAARGSRCWRKIVIQYNGKLRFRSRCLWSVSVAPAKFLKLMKMKMKFLSSLEFDLVDRLCVQTAAGAETKIIGTNSAEVLFMVADNRV